MTVHDSDHPHDGTRWARFTHRLRHRHEAPTVTKVSLIGLGATALLQAAIVAISGSVALASDTVHNLGDALTAIPLWIAFALGRRRPSSTYTYGLARAEDLAGLVIVVAIGASAVLVGWESIDRLFAPRLIDQVPWVIVAGMIGAAGNEAVARYRVRIGKRIGSEALVADGRHARADAWTSLAVVAAGVGAALGLPWMDPAAGLVVAVAIAWLLIPAARATGRRLLDGVDPMLVTNAEGLIRSVPGVRGYTDLRMRMQGHRLHLTACIQVDPGVTLAAGHEIAHQVEHELHHRLAMPLSATVHVEPHGSDEAHRAIAHHR